MVEGILDGVQGQQRGRHQHGDTDPGQLARLHAEHAQIFLHLLARRRHEVAEDERLDRLAKIAKGRHRGEHDEGHGHQRHHREQRGVGQCRRTLRPAIGEETADQMDDEAPRHLQVFEHCHSLVSKRHPGKFRGMRRRG
ncbi:hypothetical protein D9M71_624060 [compost metagenome]